MGDLYEYSGLEAEWYDVLDELCDFEDFAFLRWFADAGCGPVLDIGCGTGRVLAPLAEAGYEVAGLDASAAMLRLCREELKRRGLEARLEKGDMRGFDLGKGSFATVMIPGFSVQLLTDDADFLACLNCCREHLKPGGQLVLPTYLPWEMIWDARDRQPLEEMRSTSDPVDGRKRVALQGWELDSVSQRIDLLNRWELREADGELILAEEKQMTIRWDLPHEMLSYLTRAGFGEVSLYGDFTFDPPEDDSDSVIYVAKAG